MTDLERWVCVHAHFYQPPRENPWLEYVERQASAYPFHDWNERVSVECYAPNGQARILDDAGKVVRIVNNYSRISFNVGPTLLDWMEEKDPETYAAILEADKVSIERFSGHGSAIAQVYNHVIMPLASRRDKETQILWGMRDFERRFGRAPESLWLSETAVDMETLEILAANGIRYVILAPNQASRIRRNAKGERWRSVSGDRIDPRRPYAIMLPGGKEIAAFFYDGPVSRAIAFEGLLHNGRTLAQRLLQAFDPSTGDSRQLVHVATDGETYGHHHRHGEMALAYALEHLEKDENVHLTVYGEYLERFPPEYEATIFENSSWSCVHGIERWRSDCGCNTGRPGFNQSWRAPLRQAFDELKEELNPLFETELADKTSDPWAARNAYIEVILDRSPETISRFLTEWCSNPTDPTTTARFLKAMEMQRQLMLMYTSCAWFFDDVTGLEVVQNLKYAYRALQLAEDLFGPGLGEAFFARLSEARSNGPEGKTARDVFEDEVRSARVDLRKVAAQFAANALFQTFPEGPGAIERQAPTVSDLYSYKVQSIGLTRREAGKAQMVVARLIVRSNVTRDEADLCVGGIHFGDHNVAIGVGPTETHDPARVAEEMGSPFSRGDLPGALRVLDRTFSVVFSLKDLFADDQARLLDQILQSSLSEVEQDFERLHKTHYALMCFLSELKQQMPKVFVAISQFVQNRSIEEELASDKPSTESIRRWVEDAQRWGTALDKEAIALWLQRAMGRQMDRYEADLADPTRLDILTSLAELSRDLPFDVDVWRIQNRFYRWCERGIVSRRTGRVRPLDPEDPRFIRLAAALNVAFKPRPLRAPRAQPPEREAITP